MHGCSHFSLASRCEWSAYGRILDCQLTTCPAKLCSALPGVNVQQKWQIWLGRSRKCGQLLFPHGEACVVPSATGGGRSRASRVLQVPQQRIRVNLVALSCVPPAPTPVQTLMQTQAFSRLLARINLNWCAWRRCAGQATPPLLFAQVLPHSRPGSHAD